MAGATVLASVTSGVAGAVKVALSVSLTAGPIGGVPVAVAVFTTVPASMSACVTVYEAAQVVHAPGANDDTGQVTADRPGSGSDTPIAVSVTVPVLVTRNE